MVNEITNAGMALSFLYNSPGMAIRPSKRAEEIIPRQMVLKSVADDFFINQNYAMLNNATTTRNIPFTGFTKAGETVPEPGKPIGDLPRIDVEILIRQEVEACLNACPRCRSKSCGVKEASEILNVEEDTIRNWINSGKLMASNISRRYLIRFIDIDALLSKHQVVVPITDKRFKRNKIFNSIKH